MTGDIVLLVTVLLWALSMLRLVLLQVNAWQIKEYRWDRMREYLRLGSTRRSLMGPLELAKWLLLLLYAAGNTLFGFYSWFVLAVYFLELIVLVVEFFQHMLIRPKLTLKALILMIVSVLVSLGMFTGFYFEENLSSGALLFLDRLVWVVVMVLVGMLFPLSRYFIVRKIRSAKKHLLMFPQITTIGITGSYGKSSTKNIVATLLEGENPVVTPGNTNTEIGVASFILSQINSSTKYFVAELGAYRLGEIKSLADLIKPKIGLLTAIGNQHLGLFGSRENIKRAKYELIEALPTDGVAIFNADDPICMELAEKTKHCKVWTYGGNEKADLRAQIISVDENEIEARIFGLVPETTLQIPLLGKHQLSNVLAGILVAISLGKKWDDIQQKIRRIKTIKQTMEKFTTTNGALVIDDSYNANVEGVIAAIENIGSMPQQKKIIILTPMIELGSDAEKSHELVGAALARFATKVFYTGTDFKREILRGAKKVNKDFQIEIQTNAKAIMKKLNKEINKDTVILLEGRILKHIRESLHTK